jgi:thiamine kinase-like enzyme
MNRFATIAALTEPGPLGSITGPITTVHTEPLHTIGFSASELQKLTVVFETGNTQSFIVKKTDRQADWLSQRSRDGVGREAALLEEPCLQQIWNKLHCPYVAFAREGKQLGLLMEDLSTYLFPDVREPIDAEAEKVILDSISSVHAAFWEEAEIKKLSWLTRPQDYFNLLRPGAHEEDEYCAPPDKIREHILQGWELALQLLPVNVKNFLTLPVEEIFAPWKDLPVTLLHGDLKIANMALLPGGKLSLFDWPMVGYAPCGIELGWYLAVNATRLAQTKEEVVLTYRNCLQSHLPFLIDEKLWDRMMQLAIVTGSIMLLWSKALGKQSGTEKGKQEWDWWSGRLEEVVERVE